MKKQKLPGIISVLILTLITSVVWISFSVYKSFSSKPEATIANEVLEPINPNLDTATLDKINSKTYLDESEIPEVQIQSSGNPVSTTPLPVITPAASPGATETEVPEPQAESTPEPEI